MTTDLMPATKSYEKWSSLIKTIEDVQADKKSTFAFRVTANRNFELGILNRGNWTALNYHGVGDHELRDTLDLIMPEVLAGWVTRLEMRRDREKELAQEELKKVGLID